MHVLCQSMVKGDSLKVNRRLAIDIIEAKVLSPCSSVQNIRDFDYHCVKLDFNNKFLLLLCPWPTLFWFQWPRKYNCGDTRLASQKSFLYSIP